MRRDEIGLQTQKCRRNAEEVEEATEKAAREGER